MPSGGTAGGNVLLSLAGSKPPKFGYTDIDPARTNRIANILKDYDLSASPTGRADYLSAYAAATPQARKIAGANLDWLTRYATGAYDPTQSYRDILGANQAALGTFLINPALNELTRQRKESQARAGYGGSGQGTYDRLLQDRTLQLLASQAVPNLLGNTTAAYGTAAGLENQNVLNRLGIIGSGEQYKQLDIPALRYLEPTRLVRSDIQANLKNLSDISALEDLNRAYYRKQSGLERAGLALNAFQSGLVNEANQFADLYSKYAGLGGIGGGGLGGLSTGGASKANAEDFSIPGYYYDDRPYIPYGSSAYRAGGGGNAEVLAMLARYLQSTGAGTVRPTTPTYPSNPYLYPGV